MNALARDEVGKYLNASFVATYQKVGTFRLVGGAKQGGNVASYFCTPDGRVLHAVAGPVDGPTMLREARWAVETYKLASLEDPRGLRLKTFFRRAHIERLQNEHGMTLKGGRGRRMPRLDRPGQVHLLLSGVPLPQLGQVYKLVFERILGEKISTAPVVQVGKR